MFLWGREREEEERTSSGVYVSRHTTTWFRRAYIRGPSDLRNSGQSSRNQLSQCIPRLACAQFLSLDKTAEQPIGQYDIPQVWT